MVKLRHPDLEIADSLEKHFFTRADFQLLVRIRNGQRELVETEAFSKQDPVLFQLPAEFPGFRSAAVRRHIL